MDIDTGDSVLHAPSGETLVVAYVRDDRFAWCGWPPGEGKLVDCTLVDKADEAYRQRLLEEMAKCRGNDPRWQYARKRLGIS